MMIPWRVQIEQAGYRKDWVALAKVWDTIRDSDIPTDKVVYNSLVKHFAKAQKWHKIIEVRAAMARRSAELDSDTFIDLLTENGKASRFQEVAKLEAEFRKSGKAYTPKLASALMTIAIRAGALSSLEDAIKWLQQGGFAVTQSSCNAMIHAFAEQLEWDKVDQVQDYMVKSGIRRNAETFQDVLAEYTRVANVKGLNKTYLIMAKAGILPPGLSLSTLVQLAASMQEWDVVETLRKSTAKNHGMSVKAYTEFIRMYITVGQFDKVKEVSKEMAEKRIAPTVDMYNTMLDAYSTRDNSQAMESLFNSMPRNGVAPNLQTYALVAAMLCRTDRIEGIYGIAKRMKADRVPYDEHFTDVLARYYGPDVVQDILRHATP